MRLEDREKRMGEVSVAAVGPSPPWSAYSHDKIIVSDPGCILKTTRYVLVLIIIAELRVGIACLSVANAVKNRFLTAFEIAIRSLV
jgi:hypothetical protein